MDYVLKAIECLELSQSADGVQREYWVRAAQQWTELARKGEGDAHARGHAGIPGQGEGTGYEVRDAGGQSAA